MGVPVVILFSGLSGQENKSKAWEEYVLERPVDQCQGIRRDYRYR